MGGSRLFVVRLARRAVLRGLRGAEGETYFSLFLVSLPTGKMHVKLQ